MANKRTIKKRIQQVCGEAAVEVLLNLPGDTARKVVLELANLQSHALAKVSFSFDRTPSDFENRKQYNAARAAYTRAAFDRLHKDFAESLRSIVKEINAGLTDADRQANKAAVAE